MKYLFAGFILSLAFSVSAQFDHESVFSDLEGEALREALVDNFKTSTVLTYSQARDTFFRNIDAVDNVLECVYTGFKITLDPTADPTTDAFGKGINTEHTYPRSKGALENTNGYSDMHHLFPTREVANTARGNLPFSDINDSQTDKWYFEDNVITQIPSQGIDNYSELLTNEFFEPREKHKGDVARAYFYFYTMYRNQADQAAPNYFGLQQETLCQWHFEDPVDEKEWNRNIKISEYQEGKRNPFILDCKLARLYCDQIEGSCLSVNTLDEKISTLTVKPNPTDEVLFLELENTNAEQYIIYSAAGKAIQQGWIDKTESNTTIDVNELERGFYVLRVYDANQLIKGASKFIKL